MRPRCSIPLNSTGPSVTELSGGVHKPDREERASAMALRLMVVDDDPEVLKWVEGVVEPLGYEVVVVEDGQEAARRVTQEKFDGVLLNADMPHVDSCALARRVRASPANRKSPIAMLNGAPGTAALQDAFNAGVTFFLEKPADGKPVRALLKAMHGAMVREKRDHIRVPVRIAVQWSTGGHDLGATSLDISVGGMLVELAENIALGEEGDLAFSVRRVNGRLGVRLRARVARKEPPNRVAFQFVELAAPEAEAALREFLAGIAEG